MLPREVVFLCLILFVLCIGLLPNALALRQVAGQIDVELHPGEIQHFQWGLIADTEEESVVELRADGDGSEFLSLPSSVSLDIGKLTWVNVSVSIPPAHPGLIVVHPILVAKVTGETGGSTVISLQVQKQLTVSILENLDPRFRSIDSLAEFPQRIMLDGQEISLHVSSSSTISDFVFSEELKQVSFRVSGQNGTSGTTILPLDLILKGPYTVLLDGKDHTDVEILNETDGTVRINYDQNEHRLVVTGTEVVPEFTYPLVMGTAALLMVLAFISPTLKQKMRF